MTPDEEIREMIREFRDNYRPSQYCKKCPFVKPNGKFLCSICTKIFNIMPPIADAYYTGSLSKRWKKHRNGSISFMDETCPCYLYGPEYTAYKIAEFIGE